MTGFSRTLHVLHVLDRSTGRSEVLALATAALLSKDHLGLQFFHPAVQVAAASGTLLRHPLGMNVGLAWKAHSRRYDPKKPAERRLQGSQVRVLLWSTLTSAHFQTGFLLVERDTQNTANRRD